MQLQQLRRTHVVPEDDAALRRLGRSLGSSRSRSRSSRRLARTRREVRRLHEKLFYRPLLAAVARLRADEARLTPEAAEQRLAALGYEDPPAALRHLEALTSGVSRPPTIQRTLLPGDARVVRGRAGPGRRPVRLPQDLRGAGQHALVPRRCSATRARSPSAWHGSWPPAATPPTCCEREPGRGAKLPTDEALQPLLA